MIRKLHLAALLLFFSYLGFTYPIIVTNTSEVDSLIRSVKLFLNEDPQKALNLSEKANSLANKQNYPEKIKCLLLLSESYSNLYSYDKANLYVDSALSLAERKNLISEKVNALCLLGKIKSKSGDKESYIKLLNAARKLAQKKKTIPEEIAITLIIADIQKQEGKYQQSVATKKSLIDIYKNLSDKGLLADCWNSLGSTYWYYSHFNEALESYYKGFIIREALKDTLAVIASLKNLSNTYRDLGDYDKSISQLNQALKLSVQQKNESEKSDILNLLGSVHLRFNKYNEALFYYNQSLEIRENLGLLNSCANTLENIARASSQKNQFDEAVAVLEKAYLIRQQLFDPLATAATLNEMGNVYNQRGNIAEALRRYLMSLKIRQEIGNDIEIAKSLTNIGLTYRKLGLVKNATKYLEQAKELVNEEDPSQISYILINLGNLYMDQKMYNDALQVFQLTLSHREKTGDEISIAKSLRSLAIAQQQTGQYEKAKSNLNRSLKIVRRLNDGKSIADILNDLGNLERQRGKLKEAVLNFQEAVKVYDESAIFDGKALCLRKVGEVQVQLGQLDSAEKNINYSISLGKELGNMVLVHYGYLALHDYNKATKNYKLALSYFTRHIQIRDSLDNLRRNETNLEAQLDLELDKKKEEIRTMEGEVDNLRKEAALSELRIIKQRNLQNILILVVLFVLVIAGILLFAYNQKRKHNKLLEEKIDIIRQINDKLAQSEIDLTMNVQTKDKLFSIIAHDLRSPFTALVGLTEILASNSSRLSKEEVQEYSDQIHKSSEQLLSLIENLLSWSRSQSGKLTLNPALLNLKTIIDSLVQINSLYAKTKNITITTRIPDATMIFADSETVSTVFRNILSNAIKFTPKNGQVSISAVSKDNTVEILISDTGNGISEDILPKLFQLNKKTMKGTSNEPGTGLGLLICKEFVEKNNGSISVQSELNIGSAFKITLPKHPAYE